jgi:small subunit ribosomal protein S18
LLKKYISDSAKILPTRITNVSHSKQKILVREIKRARALALLPYVGN